MKAIIKKPGQGAEVIEIDKRTGVNDVLGYSIGAVKVASDFLITYDPRAFKRGESFNFETLGRKFFGKVLIVGLDPRSGRTAFADVPELERIEKLIPSLKRKKRVTIAEPTA